MKEHDFTLMRHDVEHWARTNAQEDWRYGSPQSYWRGALSAGIITREQYEYAAAHYGNMWNYRGD